MCGVYGVLSFEKTPNKLWLRKIFQNLAKGNERRGPDSSSEVEIEKDRFYSIIGHSRLEVTGTDSTGYQPVKIFEKGRESIIVFNGQIYNADKLAKKYSIEFNPVLNSDTKIATQLFDRHQEFDGMFALAKLCVKTQTLTLVRDPFGIKPIYWARVGKTVIFSSFLQPIVNSGLAEFISDPESNRALFELNFNPKRNTFFKDIYQVHPGEVVKISKETTTFERQNLKQDFFFQAKTSYCIEKLEELFLKNLEQTIPKTQNFVIALSSGLDSSLIAAGCKKLGYNPKTITLDFPATRQTASEGQRAQILAEHLGLENICLKITSSMIEKQREKISAASDHPSKDGINTYLLAQEASKHAKVILSGLGADELFFGYRSTAQGYKALTGGTMERLIKSSFANILPESIKYRTGLDFWAKLSKFKTPIEMVVASRALKFNGLENYQELAKLQKELVDFDTKTQFILAELFCYTQPVLLRDSDWASMNFGLELRVPFLNQAFAKQIIAWQSSSPGQYLNKQWLWQLAQKWKIADFISKRKKGFVPPKT